MKYYKKWAFRLFIYVLIMNVVSFGLTVSYVDLAHDTTRLVQNLLLLGIMSTICLLVGLIMVVLCIINKEVNDGKTWTATIGLSFFLVASILTYLIG